LICVGATAGLASLNEGVASSIGAPRKEGLVTRFFVVSQPRMGLSKASEEVRGIALGLAAGSTSGSSESAAPRKEGLVTRFLPSQPRIGLSNSLELLSTAGPGI
jgi:hypothetical protein